MEKWIVTCGFSEQEKNLLNAVMPAEYEVKYADDITDMIVTSALCYIVSGENLAGDEYRLLKNYCIEVGDYGNERIFWIGDDPPCEMMSVYGSILDFMLDLENALKQAREHYATHEMYCSEYAVLPARAIADSLEQDIHTAFRRIFPGTTGEKISKQLRQEWTAVLETAAAPELAAVYELSQWLKSKKIPYYMGGSVTSGRIPYLLGITRVNPMPKELGGFDLVWQNFCSYGDRPTFVFHLSKEMETKITSWKKSHWIRNLNPDLAAHWDQNFSGVMSIQFEYDLDETTEPKMSGACQEDIFHCLVRAGFLEKDAVNAMKILTLGGFVPDAMRDALTDQRLRLPGLPSRAETMERFLYVNSRKSE